MMERLEHLLEHAVARYPDRLAVVAKNEALTYAELYRQAVAGARRLQEAVGETPGHVGISLPRSCRYLVAYFAIAFARGIVVPLDPKLTDAEAATVLRYCDISVVVTDGASDRWERLCPGVGFVKAGSFEIIRRSHMHFVEPDAHPDAAIMLPTSGTLSRPKRVVHTHRGLLWNATAHARSVGLDEDDRCLVALPVHFGYCNTAQLICHLRLGGTLVLYSGLFHPRQFFDYVQHHRITTFTAVPSMLQYLLDYQRQFPADDLAPTLRFLCFGGAPVSRNWVERLQRAFPNSDVIQTYGQTEAGPRITTLSTRRSPDKIASVGQSLEGVLVRVVGPSNEEVPPGQIGEVIVQSPSLMTGYYRRAQETAEVLQNGWLRTGDLGYQNSDGFLYITGRKKNLIIRAGCNMQPEEVEECLRLHPGVEQALVMGEEDSTAGERVVAYVVRRGDSQVEGRELVDHCRDYLSAYKVPSRVTFVSQLELTSNGKIRRVLPQTGGARRSRMPSSMTPEAIRAMDYVNFTAFLKETNRPPGGKHSVRLIAQNAFLQQGHRVLEIGCNTGFTSIELAKTVHATIVGVDVNPAAVAVAASRAEEEGCAQLTSFQVADACSLPFDGECFDSVVTGGANAWIQDRQKALTEYWRVLKNWGFLCTVPFYYRTEPPDGLVEQLNRSLGIRIQKWKRSFWVDLFVEAGYEPYYIQEEVPAIVVSAEQLTGHAHYLAERLFAPEQTHLLRATEEKVLSYWRLFNENNRYLAYGVMIFRKRRKPPERTLFD